MVIVTRSNEIYSSPRIEKYIEFFEKENIDYLAIGWDRKNKKINRKNTIYFRANSGYALGGIKAAVFRIGWMIFLFNQLLARRDKLAIIHAFDLDTAFPASIFKTLFGKNIKVIFDVCDWFSANLHNQNKFFIFVFKQMEKFAINHVDEVILCEPERVKQIPFALKRKEIIVPNIPVFENINFLFYDDGFSFNNEKLRVSYVGGFSDQRLIAELLEIAELEYVNLLIAGYGDSLLEQRCKKIEHRVNVKYFGKVEYRKGLNIMYNSDLIFAMYSRSNPNHNFAAPNKYYEAMMLGKPILSTKGLSIGDKILHFNIGFVCNDTKEDLIECFSKISRHELEEKGKNALELWENTYKNFNSNFFEKKYKSLILKK